MAGQRHGASVDEHEGEVCSSTCLHGGAVCSTQSPAGGGRTKCREDTVNRKGECGSGARYLASDPVPPPACLLTSGGSSQPSVSYLLSGVSSHRDPWLHSCSSLSRKALLHVSLSLSLPTSCER